MTENGTGLEKTDWTDIFVLRNLPLGFLLLLYNETEKQHLWKPPSLHKEAFLSKVHLALVTLLLCSKIISGLGEKNSWKPQDVEAVSWCFIHFTHFSYKAQSQPLRAKISQVESKRDLCVNCNVTRKNAQENHPPWPSIYLLAPDRYSLPHSDPQHLHFPSACKSQLIRRFTTPYDSWLSQFLISLFGSLLPKWIVIFHLVR